MKATVKKIKASIVSCKHKFIIWKDKTLDHGAEHELMIFQQLTGRFYVVYPDGRRSVKMSYSTAKDYRDIFGGSIYHYNYGKIN